MARTRHGQNSRIGTCRPPPQILSICSLQLRRALLPHLQKKPLNANSLPLIRAAHSFHHLAIWVLLCPTCTKFTNMFWASLLSARFVVEALACPVELHRFVVQALA